MDAEVDEIVRTRRRCALPDGECRAAVVLDGQLRRISVSRSRVCRYNAIGEKET